MLTVIIDHAGAISQLIGIIAGVIEIIRRQSRLAKQIHEVHLMVNSRLDQLLEKAGTVGRFEGAAAERLETIIRDSRKIP